uniref:Si:dkey-19b23.13 n=1 Tax=Scleropages formosus TaxID=113540 RepID=A0A8C9V8Q3_SCLFO
HLHRAWKGMFLCETERERERERESAVPHGPPIDQSPRSHTAPLGPLTSRLTCPPPRMPERVHRFQGQCYYKLKRACQHRGVLFQDPLFPPAAQSLFYQRPPPPGLAWKRPRELCKDPRLFVDGISTRDLHQGSLGNCWMVAATSCLATESSLWKKVIPDHTEQEWNPKRLDLYAGIFHFRFWRLGRWVDVVVDDRLPVGQDGQLLFCRSASPREFWSALLEKAYAKLNGCYEALEGGNTAEALVDFTGGVSEPLSLDRKLLVGRADKRKVLFQTLARAHSRQALITCSIRPAEGEAVESVLSCGLVCGHAYGITAVRKVRLGERLQSHCGTTWVNVVRMRNPWGTSDWTGAWSQGSEQWQLAGRVELERMGIIVRDVGEFWMEFDDFCRFFTDVVVCRVAERRLLWPRSHWREVRCHGDGRHTDRRSRCGGCINHRDTFLNNPQFLFEVRGHGDEVLICLQQEDRRIWRSAGGGENLPIGFEVLKVEANRSSRVQCVGEQAASSVYMDSRSVALRVTLAPARYVLLPTTFHPGSTGRFLLRLFSHSRIQLRQLENELPCSSLYRPCVPLPLCPWTTAAAIYAIIRCEEKAVRTRVFKHDSNPKFNTKAIFYRKYPDSHIRIEVRSSQQHLLLWVHSAVWGGSGGGGGGGSAGDVSPAPSPLRACADLAPGTAVGFSAGCSQAADRRQREGAQASHRSAGGPDALGDAGERLRGDFLQPAPH